jgi:hypothetical protein
MTGVPVSSTRHHSTRQHCGLCVLPVWVPVTAATRTPASQVSDTQCQLKSVRSLVANPNAAPRSITRNVHRANDLDLLLRFLWSGVSDGMNPTCTGPWTAGPEQQSTVLNTGVNGGTAVTLEQALVMAINGLEQQGYYGQQVLFVPRSFLATRDGHMWDQRGERLYADGHLVIGVPGAPLPGLTGSTATWHIAAVAGVEYDRANVTVKRLEPDFCGGLEQGVLRTESFIARLTVAPRPVVVGIQ